MKTNPAEAPKAEGAEHLLHELDVPPPPAKAIDEPPPFLGSWRNIYLLLLIELAVLVIAFFALTGWAS